VLSDVQLRVVPIEDVRPHEIADPARERRIERRLVEDDVLRDPLLVGAVPDMAGYVLLDGTNRKRALERLGVSGLLVQVIEYADPRAVQLRTWCHAAALSLARVLEQVEALPETEIEELSPLEAPDALRDRDVLAVALDRHRHVLVRRTASMDRPAQLRAFVDIYEDTLTRVDCEPDDVEETATALSASGEGCLIAFPAFTRAQVVALAMHGTLIPAGITRHVILQGRALRVNLPLDVLEMADGLESANAALRDHLGELSPRVYTEPTVLFDS
jgi:hypothetical protein